MRLRHAISLGLSILLLGACGDDDDDTSIPARILDLQDATSAECPNGGQVVVIGTDTNGDGVLTDSEIESRQPVCSGAPGAMGTQGPRGSTALVRVRDEAPGTNCALGGVRIEAGTDVNGSGTLEGTEVEQVQFACDGPAGAAGRVSLSRTRDAPSNLCENGGIVVEFGLDLDGDQTLDNDEVTTSETVCNGRIGEQSLSLVTGEPAGANCIVGGQRVDIGVDENGNGTLEVGEIDETAFVCDPVQSAIRVSPELAATSTACPGRGGSRIEVGPDTNANGQLDNAEVLETTFVCTGTTGAQSLLAVTPEPAGMNCAAGGNRVQSGLDTNGNGSLDASEIVSTNYFCDGVDGAAGSGGNAVRVSAEPPGMRCTEGGVRIETGPDTNGNGALEDVEVTNTTFACGGVATQTLVTTANEPMGMNCAGGGIRIDRGVDDDRDGVLDANEVDGTQFVCNTTNPTSVPFAITTQTLPDTFTVFNYDETITAFGGTGGSYTWSISAGALPPNFSLQATGTPSTRVTGSGSSPGTYTFTVRVTDFFGQFAERSYTIEVSAPPCSAGMNGLVGQMRTTITAPSSFGSGITGVAADDNAMGFIYVIDSGGSLERFAKDGSTEENLLSRLPGITSGLINSIHVIGNDIFLTNDDTSCDLNCVRRISSDRGQTFSVQDLGDFRRDGDTNDALQGVAVTGQTLWAITNDPVDAQLWSIDLGAATFPTTATLAATLRNIDTCNGLGADATYFYSACDDIGNGREGLARINRTTFVTEPVADLTLNIGSGSWGEVHVVDTNADGSADVAYVQGDNNSSTTSPTGATYFVCNPGGTLPAFASPFGVGTQDDEGLGYDPANNALFQIQESSRNIFRFN